MLSIASAFGDVWAVQGQTDVINTSGEAPAPSDQMNTSGPQPERCGPPQPDPLWGAADAWPEGDRTWFALAQDGYYARCVGSCGVAYCFKNPCYESDSAPGCLLASAANEPPEIVVMDDGTPVQSGDGNQTDNGSGVSNCFIPDSVPPQERATWYQSHCLAQVPPSVVRAPTAIPAEIKYDYSPGAPTVIEVPDARNIPRRATFVSEVGGGPPTEAGLDPDWQTWYDIWIKRLVVHVDAPRKDRFFPDRGQYRTVVDCIVYPDGNIQFLVDNARGNPHGALIFNQFQALSRSPKAPPFPKGSHLPYVQRTVTFTHNTGDVDIRAGPPRGR